MGLIKSSQSHAAAQSAVVLDLGDLARQAESLRERAHDEAQAIIARARAQREQLVRGGREQGYEEGRKAGYDDGLERGIEEGRERATSEAAERFQSVEGAWTRSLAQFEAERDEMLDAARDQILKVAAMCAELVTKRVVEIDERVVASQMEAVLVLVSRAGRLSLRVNPDDEAAAREALPGLLAKLGQDLHAELVVDPLVSRGSCLARTPSGGEIDAAIETQLDRVLDVLLPRRADEADGMDGAELPPAEAGDDQNAPHDRDDDDGTAP